MNNKQSGFSILGVLMVLLLIGFLAYQYVKPEQKKVNSEAQIPKTQKQVNDIKNKLNQQSKQQQSERDSTWENL